MTVSGKRMKTSTTNYSLRPAGRLPLLFACALVAAGLSVVGLPDVAAAFPFRPVHQAETGTPGDMVGDAVDDDFDAALAAVRAEEARRIDVFAKAVKAVVCVFADRQRGGGGSGVLIDSEGYGLTNYHVVQPFIGSRHAYGGLSDGCLYPLKVLGIDPGGDIVMFKLEGRNRFDCAPLGDSDALRVGQPVAALGNPFVLAEDNQPTVTLGVISGLHRYQEGQGNLLEYADCIQVSTSINPGNSGGPLVDLQGRVIGINGRASFQEDEAYRHRVNVGLGYAVSINQIKRFMPGLRAGRLLEHGTLGATVRAAGGDLIISAIQTFSPAEAADVQLGDQLLGVAGRRVRTPNDYNNIMATLPADWPVTLELLRDGQPVETAARLERLPLRMPMLYVLDLEHNQAELARILERSSRGIWRRPEEQPSQVAFQGKIRHAGAEDRQAFTWLVGPAGDGNAQGEAAPPPGDALDASVCEEWRRLTWPLLARVDIGLQWELLAGDEVAGRIVNVVENRFDADRRIRWKFDWLTDELLQVACGDRERVEAVIWSPSAPREFGEFVWPSRWTRRTHAGDLVQIEIESVAASASAVEPIIDRQSPEQAE
jgi:S1-C subfamily serine protease